MSGRGETLSGGRCGYLEGEIRQTEGDDWARVDSGFLTGLLHQEGAGCGWRKIMRGVGAKQNPLDVL